MKEKAKKVFHFLKKRVRLSVIIGTLLFGVLLLIGSYSYAFYTISTEKENVLSLAAVRFDYVLNEQYENEMTLSFTEQEISEFPIRFKQTTYLQVHGSYIIWIQIPQILLCIIKKRVLFRMEI